jgi:5'-phosphate synthase pdxT subunit
MESVGVLALQGSFEAHARSLRALGVEAVEVRRVARLAGLAGLIVPGGESTTLLNLMRDEPWFDGLRALHRRGGVLLGTCAGAILLAREVNPPQPSLGLIDVAIRRNAYGRQVDSFEAWIDVEGSEDRIRAAFIRAPRLERPGPGVETLARLRGEPVLMRQGRVFAATFHTELTGEPRLHQWFLRAVRTARATGKQDAPRPVSGTAPSGLVA